MVFGVGSSWPHDFRFFVVFFSSPETDEERYDSGVAGVISARETVEGSSNCETWPYTRKADKQSFMMIVSRSVETLMTGRIEEMLIRDGQTLGWYKMPGDSDLISSSSSILEKSLDNVPSTRANCRLDRQPKQRPSCSNRLSRNEEDTLAFFPINSQTGKASLCEEKGLFQWQSSMKIPAN